MPHNNFNYEFGPYQLDLSKRVLSRNGETISLTPKATEILVMLVTNAGQLVERDELLRQVWPDTFVEEANLSQNIFLLRRALGDERAGPRFIETVTRRGYRFIADVKVVGGNGQRVGEVEPNAAGAPRPVVAVLPFLNTTGDSELEYLADGVTDNIINNLSRVSQLRVMSHSSIGRYKTKSIDPQQVGKDLGASAVLVGRIHSRRSAIGVSVELVEVSNGWQLWGESFDSESKDLLEIQDAITRHVLATLKLKLTGEEEKRVTARYTENAEAYQSYLEGRYHWSRYTRKGIEKAIGHFRKAIELDPNYALAYAAIVDCYLRLATNYLPPEDDVPNSVENPIAEPNASSNDESEQRVRLRFEWDWKAVERELRRANELKTNYPTAHQWYAAYLTCKQLYTESFSGTPQKSLLKKHRTSNLSSQIPCVQLTPIEEVQILCSIARDQLAIGNYDAAQLLLRRWLVPGKWPELACLNPYFAADLLFTLGTLIGFIASAKQVVHGHKHAEVFLSGSVALFEQLGIKSRSAEARVELARCYYRQGLFDVARATLSEALANIPDNQPELKNSCLTLWGAVERESGRLFDALEKLREAASFEIAGDLVTARCFHELATTLKDLTISERVNSFANEAIHYFHRTIYDYEAVGNYRLTAAAENNFGFLLLTLGSLAQAESHLLRSERLFDSLRDSIRGAQVKETLTRLYIATQQYSHAQKTIQHAIEILERTDGEALLAEALTTNGVVAARQARYADARTSFEAAYKVAERCGDTEGAGRALLLMFEEIGDRLQALDKIQVSEKLKRLLAMTQQTSLQARVQKCLEQVLHET